MSVRIALVLALFLVPATALAQLGPSGTRGSYVSIRGQALSGYLAGGPTPFTGLSVDWGALQNGIIGTGTRIGFSNMDGSTALFLGGGPQVHIGLGPVLVIPALNLGTRIVGGPSGGLGGFDLAAYLSLGVGGRIGDQFYLGVEGEVPALLNNMFFPAAFSANLMAGMYF